MDVLKADAEELKEVAKGEGSLKDKAKAATQAIKEPAPPACRRRTARDCPASEPTSHAAGGRQYGGRSSYQAPRVLKARQKRCLAPSSSSESSMSGT